MKGRSVLLVPDAGDDYALLKEGVCGSRPPKAIELRLRRDDTQGHELLVVDLTAAPRWYDSTKVRNLSVPTEEGLKHIMDARQALVLAWKGSTMLQEGIRWLSWRFSVSPNHDQGEAEKSLRTWISESAIRQGSRSSDRLRFPGYVVLVDENGFEIKD